MSELQNMMHRLKKDLAPPKVAPRGSRPCSACDKRVGGVDDELPANLCGTCREVAYCSRECQVSDWKNHRKLCAEYRRKEEARDKAALAEPLNSVLRDDLKAYSKEIEREIVAFAFRSAFRLGHRDECLSTHRLVLSLRWDPQPKKLRKRFECVKAEVLAIPNASPRPPTRGSYDVDEDEQAFVEGEVVLMVLDRKTGEITECWGHPKFGVTLSNWPFAPLSITPINHNWASDLQASLRDPITPSETLLPAEDLVLSFSPISPAAAEALFERAFEKWPKLKRQFADERVRIERERFLYAPETSSLELNPNFDFKAMNDMIKSLGMGDLSHYARPISPPRRRLRKY
ncbi:hypothetical protein BCR35DRAFT_307717 [Leucosporidium creatinivorum]|uniref:MYND-type domain-containing protein n=1 Tax=Leucosporidium creatinivorum TaxID=106004 RepID=A0A1Y2ELL1_9BASI|nr:hypothetical protein BCR35DRAFT_307717 [Leucosporidium creatinivorum]